MAVSGRRSKPNILVTGTPGTGKTTLCSQIVEQVDLQHIDVSKLVNEQELYSGWDDELDCSIFDEDKVCDALEDTILEGGYIIDFHSCNCFPERWFDLVVVLTTNNTILYDRLASRQYSQKKITANVECEIMQMLVSEAQESYAEEIVQVLQNDTIEQMESNVQRIIQWNHLWMQQHGS
eukprot:TRINITY_DN17095_c0_g3_i2.p1 TRINITY_DN17095_c0_g3~~TRINITY_DN17095_c0_g3_i2.p1  ORF type:complete len:193 (-),score=9.49 TRINITY_DN17095_c0_g3_i2:364-900(-)